MQVIGMSVMHQMGDFNNKSVSNMGWFLALLLLSGLITENLTVFLFKDFTYLQTYSSL